MPRANQSKPRTMRQRKPTGKSKTVGTSKPAKGTDQKHPKVTCRRKSTMVKYREDTVKFTKVVDPLTATKRIQRIFKNHVQRYLEKYPIGAFNLASDAPIGGNDDPIKFNIQMSASALRAIKTTHWTYMERILMLASNITTSRGEKKTTSDDLDTALKLIPQNLTYTH